MTAFANPLTGGLRRALAQRERDGMRGTVSPRTLAAGTGWSVDDVLCTHGPRDRPFEEAHARACIAVVAAGCFSYRNPAGHALLAPGALMLGRAGQCFECAHRHAPGDRCIAFHYDPDWLARVAVEAGMASAAAHWGMPRLPPLRAFAPLVARACLQVGEGAQAGRDSWDELAIGLAIAALRESARQGAHRTRSVPAATRSATGFSRVAATLRMIDETPEDAHTLASLAAAAGVSEFWFLRTFAAVAGVTPHQYLLRARLRTAALRVAREDAKIVDIALASGFNDLSNFNTMFRAEYGASPRVWRDEARARRLAGVLSKRPAP